MKVEKTDLELGDNIQLSETVLQFKAPGYAQLHTEPEKAMKLFEQCRNHAPNFLEILKNLAFLYERDVRRKTDVVDTW